MLIISENITHRQWHIHTKHKHTQTTCTTQKHRSSYTNKKNTHIQKKRTQLTQQSNFKSYNITDIINVKWDEMKWMNECDVMLNECGTYG